MSFLKNSLLLSLILTSVFFLATLFTLKDYGVSWDDVMHYRRAHAVLHYFLTGEKDYKSLPQTNFQGSKGDPNKIPNPRRSFYQNDSSNNQYFNDDWGHPPLNGLIAASLNYIFFQKIGLLDDISSHHLFNIITATLLVFVVTYFATITLGRFAGIVSFLTLTTYPLFFAESHFNVKDPAEAAFIAATIFCFYKSLEKYSLKWLFLSIISFGFALGTKFNALFIPIIILPYLLIRYKFNILHWKKLLKDKSLKKYLLFLVLVGPMVSAMLLILPWPYISSNLSNIFRVLQFYKEIGTGTNYQGEGFLLAGFNTFPIQWIMFTTPIVVLVLAAAGIVSSFLNRKIQNKVQFLWLIWFVLPILRVSLPGTSVYGGVRQIMEFLPAMALLSGLGALQIRNWFIDKKVLRFTKVSSIVILLLFIFPIIDLVNYHPYQNVYFNLLIGGLKGAKEKNFPSWGNSYGGAYLEGINWINANAEFNSKLSLIQGERANVPEILVREDIDFSNRNFSGINRGGEYLMELTFHDTAKINRYAWDYVETMLEPVYQVTVNGVPILKIWKNDFEHTKNEYKIEEKVLDQAVMTTTSNGAIRIELPKSLRLSRLVIEGEDNLDCEPVMSGIVEISQDGINWERKRDLLGFNQIKRIDTHSNLALNYFFADELVQFINIKVDNLGACILGSPKVKIYIF